MTTKPKPLLIDYKKVFKRLSLELTYLPKIDYINLLTHPKLLHLNDNIISEARQSVVDYLNDSENLQLYLPTKVGARDSDGWKGEDDDGCLEISTGLWNGYYSLRKEIVKMEAKLRGLSTYPSSLIDIDIEGGCHINIDLKYLNSLTDNIKSGLSVDMGNVFTRRFLLNLRNLILSNPSIAWCFLSPNDNASSNLRYFNNLKNYQKGDFMFIHYKYINPSSFPYDRDFNYVELRFFMMPRTMGELDLHYKFIQQLLQYVLKQTVEDYNNNYRRAISLSFKKTNLVKYTYSKSVKEIRSLCQLIGFDFNKIEKSGKLELLQWRFDYGKKWLV